MELSAAQDDPPAASGGWPAAMVLCVGVWLHAADSLLAATVMPTAIGDIGGLGYIYCTVALYELGSIAAGAATGLLASAGLWRGAFWAFAIQALLVAAAVPLILKAPPGAAPRERVALPWRRLAVLAAGVLAVLVAGVQGRPVLALAWVGAGAALLWLLRLESRAEQRLFPRRPLDPRTGWGPGYLMVLLLCFATISFGTYGAYFMETLYGTAPLVAGFVLAVESVAWTVTAVLFANAGPKAEPWLIRGGALAIGAGLAGLMVAMPTGPTAALIPWAFLQGGGFGACWPFLIRRVVESVPDREREQATSSVPTMQMLGYALGAAASGVVANLSGLAIGAPRGAIESASFWVFAAFLPPAAAGIWAAWRVGEVRAAAAAAD